MRLLTLKRVLVATDLHDGSLPALTTGRELTTAAGAALHVAHVSDDHGAIDAVTAALGDAGLPPESASVHVVRGDPAPAINILAEKIGADAILVGPHRGRRRGTSKHVMGSTALALVTHASVPCMVVPVPVPVPLRRVIAGVDMTDSARGTLVVALSWASALRVRGSDASESTVLTALHVHRSSTPANDPAAPRRALDEMLEHLQRDAGAWAGTTIESVVVDNADAAAGIVEYANAHRADMVVLGTRGLGSDDIDRLGSVAGAVTQELDTPVLLVPPSIWKTYATPSP